MLRSTIPLELAEEDERTLMVLLASMIERAKQKVWLPIETAPKDGTAILVYVPTHKFEWYKAFTAVVYWVEKEYDGTAGWFDTFDRVEPTHWMKIPEYPK